MDKSRGQKNSYNMRRQMSEDTLPVFMAMLVDHGIAPTLSISLYGKSLSYCSFPETKYLL